MINKLTSTTTTTDDLPISDGDLMPVYKALGVKRKPENEDAETTKQYQQIAEDIYSLIVAYTGRDIRVVTYTEEYQLCDATRLPLTAYPLSELTLKLDGEAFTDANYFLNTRVGVLTFSQPISGKLDATYVAKRASTATATVRRAAQLMLKNLWGLAFGTGSGSTANVSVAGLADVDYSDPRIISPDVQQLLKHLKYRAV